jgi:FkbM family methyltransferase
MEMIKIENLVKDTERIDDLQVNGLRVIQDPKGFCFGIDAILISNFAQLKEGDAAADLGCGTGVISILAAGKLNASKVVGIEIQPKVADMAKRSVLLNNLQNKIEIVNMDIKDVPKAFGKSTFDVVITNPPYKAKNSSIINPDDAKAVSRHEILCTLDDVISSSSYILKQSGRLFMVHRPERLCDIICCLRKYKIEPKRIRFVHPSPYKKPNLLLIEGLKGGRSFLKVEEPLYVYNENNEYSLEIRKIYGTEWEKKVCK